MNVLSGTSATSLRGILRAFRVPAVVALAAFTASAHASSFLTDGGLESATGGNVYYAGQSLDAGSWNVLTGAVYIDSADPYVYDGTNSLNLTYANLYVPNTVAQTFTTTPGESYALSFWADADTPNSFAVTANGVALAGSPGAVATNGFPNATNNAFFTDYTATFVASAASTTLNFTATGDPSIGSPDGSVVLDDISIATTPEPQSLVLVLSGVGVLSEAVRRRRVVR